MTAETRYNTMASLAAGLQAAGPDPEYRRMAQALGDLLGEQAATSQAVHLMAARGMLLWGALGRCAVAEAERDPRYWEYWGQVVESAGLILEVWERLTHYCQGAGLHVGEILPGGEVGNSLDVMRRMALAVVERDGRLQAEYSLPVAVPTVAAVGVLG